MKKHHFYTVSGIVFFAVIVVLSIYLFQVDRSIGYNFNQPDQVFELPDTLKEVSGIALDDEDQLICVQDENGILFRYNTKQQELVSEFNFGKDGDYEGVCKVGAVYYVLRSDGVLFEVSPVQTEEADLQTIRYQTKIPTANLEGLCLDAQHHRLLLMARGHSSISHKRKRYVYGFDLNTKKMLSKPVFRLEPFTSNAFPEKDLDFLPSEIAIHPKTGELFVLSSKDHALYVFSSEGAIQFIQRLNPLLFNKPEGLTFLPNGDLYVSNEGQSENATVLLFRYGK